MPVRSPLRIVALLAAAFFLAAGDRLVADDQFDKTLLPAFTQHCVKCHGKEKVKGKVNLLEIKSGASLVKNPALIRDVIEALDAGDMPPEDEPPLNPEKRAEMIASLKAVLRAATAGHDADRVQISRLNRFQYNNAVRDLFELKTDVFSLQEKLMTRHDNYLAAGGRMPDKVNVACHSLSDAGGLRGVQPFPKDLRAQHGFDNQANQLTLSPLLLESFLKLSVSIVESPDFNEKTVGIWERFFKAPAADADLEQEVRRRLRPFLERAFRGPVEDAALERYVNYTLAKLEAGLPFESAMKKTASAALSSPKFLFRAERAKGDQFALASRLSFLLWGSGPDQELLDLAAKGELSYREVLIKTIDRMVADPRIERFLDAFPVQWMQLENILAAVPDPGEHRYFRIDEQQPASLHMVLEPLLLFDAVFIEDRPIIELIAPSFTYRSDFLQTWYSSDLKPPAIDESEVTRHNRQIEERRLALEKTIQTAHAEVEAMEAPIRARLLAEKRKASDADERPPVDLKPYAAWEFNGDLKESIAGLDLEAHGKIRFEDGMVVLDRAYLQSKPLSIELKAKTMEVWIRLYDVKQRGGGVMTIQGPGDFFDSIVLGERKPSHWISGSNGFSRTLDFEGSTPEQEGDRPERLHLVMVYEADGTTTLYRNGERYGKPYRKGMATFPKEQTSVLFGLRHLPAGGNKYLAVSIDRARLYDRALSADEVRAAASGDHLFISESELVEALSAEQRKARAALNEQTKDAEKALGELPEPVDLNKLRQQAEQQFREKILQQVRARTFQRVPATDPRYGGVLTNAAVMTMTSSPKRTLPIERGAWVIEVILNDPPPPPPNDVPPLNEDSGPANLTIREKFAQHRANPDCAGCHSRIDPLGFALENFDITGRWRDKYDNDREVDASGTLFKRASFDDVVQFKAALVKEKERFARAFAGHLLRFALARELEPADTLTIDQIVAQTAKDDYRIRSILREVVLSEPFLQMK